MKINEILVEIKNIDGEFDFVWDKKREGFATIVNGKEVGFFKAKSLFDRSGAQEDAKKLMIKYQSNAWTKRKEADEHQYQYVKPLTDLASELVKANPKTYKYLEGNNYISLDEAMAINPDCINYAYWPTNSDVKKAHKLGAKFIPSTEVYNMAKELGFIK